MCCGLFETCPAAFKERYVDGIALEPHVDRLTEAQRLGGLERHYL